MERYVYAYTKYGGSTECWCYVLLLTIKPLSFKFIYRPSWAVISPAEYRTFLPYFCTASKIYFSKATILCLMLRNIESTHHELYVNLRNIFYTSSFFHEPKYSDCSNPQNTIYSIFVQEFGVLLLLRESLRVAALERSLFLTAGHKKILLASRIPGQCVRTGPWNMLHFDLTEPSLLNVWLATYFNLEVTQVNKANPSDCCFQSLPLFPVLQLH